MGRGRMDMQLEVPRAEVFALVIPAKLICVWEEVGDQLICQIEFFVHLAIRYRYRSRLLNQVSLAWTDNEAARFAAIKGSSIPLASLL